MISYKLGKVIGTNILYFFAHLGKGKKAKGKIMLYISFSGRKAKWIPVIDGPQYTLLLNTALHCTEIHYTVLYCSALHCIALCCTVLNERQRPATCITREADTVSSGRQCIRLTVQYRLQCITVMQN